MDPFNQEFVQCTWWTLMLAFVLPIVRHLFGWTALDHWPIFVATLAHPTFALLVGMRLACEERPNSPHGAWLLDAAEFLMFLVATLPFFVWGWVCEYTCRPPHRGDK